MKGSFTDLITIAVFVLATGMIMSLIIMVGKNVVHPILGNLTEMGGNETQMNTIDNGYKKEENAMDLFTPVIFIGLFLAALVSAYLVNTIPIFAVVYLIISVPLMIFSFIGQDLWIQWATAAGISAATMPITYSFLANIHWIILISDIILGIVMFSRSKVI